MMEKIWFDNDSIFLKTKEGHEASMPLAWFPRLAKATPKQRAHYTLSPFGVHWEEIDEDLSFEGFFKYHKEKNTSNPPPGASSGLVPTV